MEGQVRSIAPPADRFIVTESRRGMGCICENKAFSILHQAQEGQPELIKKDGGENASVNRPRETHLGNHGNTRKQRIAPSAGQNG